jgi:hypothetical protein
MRNQRNEQRTPITVPEMIAKFGIGSTLVVLADLARTGTFEFDTLVPFGGRFTNYVLVLEMEIDEWPVIYL